MCNTKYVENRRTTQKVTADENVLYLSTYHRVAHGAEPGNWCTRGTGSLPLTAVAAEVGGRGSVKVTRMMFELELACESEAALEHSRDISICSCHSFSLSFSPPAVPLNQKEKENTSAPMTGTSGPAVSKGGEGLGNS